MNERAFAERRKPTWERFEQMIKSVRWAGARHLSKEELNELGRLYRQISSDLAYVRTHGISPALGDYLNALLSQAHGVLYRAPRRGFRHALSVYFYTVPEVIRRRWKYIFTSIAITLGGALFAGVLSWSDPTWTARLVPEGFRDSLEAWKTGQQREAGSDPNAASKMSSFYFMNNTRVSMLVFGLGFFWAIPTVWLLLTNGMMLGAFSAEMLRAGKLGFFYVSIFPHGVPELSAVFLCGAGGLIIGRALLAPGDRTRIESLREEGRDAIWLLGASIPLLILAAFIEAFFSFYNFPNSAKLIMGFVGLTILLSYWLLVRPKRAQTDPVVGKTL